VTRQPRGKHTAAALDHATLRALVDALHAVTDLLNAGAREQAEPPRPQRQKQRRAR